jgi:hypothetical protein
MQNTMKNQKLSATVRDGWLVMTEDGLCVVYGTVKGEPITSEQAGIIAKKVRSQLAEDDK